MTKKYWCLQIIHLDWTQCRRDLIISKRNVIEWSPGIPQGSVLPLCPFLHASEIRLNMIVALMMIIVAGWRLLQSFPECTHTHTCTQPPATQQLIYCIALCWYLILHSWILIPIWAAMFEKHPSVNASCASLRQIKWDYWCTEYQKPKHQTTRGSSAAALGWRVRGGQQLLQWRF